MRAEEWSPEVAAQDFLEQLMGELERKPIFDDKLNQLFGAISGAVYMARTLRALTEDDGNAYLERAETALTALRDNRVVAQEKAN